MPAPGASQRDRAAGLAHDPVHHREAEPRTLSRSLRREEGLEGAVARRLVHPDAGILDVDRDVRSGDHVEHRGGAEVERLLVGANGEGAAAQHRIARVDRQVDEHLLELPRIGDDGGVLDVAAKLDLHRAAEHAHEQPLDAGDDVVDVEQARRAHFLPAEDEQLAREGRPARHGVADVRHLFLQRIVRGERLAQRLGGAERLAGC